jgi:hypothetical protein
MRIFLSYASQDREAAESIYLPLRDQGHQVFFDRADLLAGEEFHNRIRAEIEGAELFIFLFSSNAVDAGSYTLTELDIGVKAKIKLLPVALGKLDAAELPASLEAVTVLESDGNLAAAVAAEVHCIARAVWQRRLKYVCAAATSGSFPGATMRRAMSARDFSSLIRTPYTKTVSRRWAVIPRA